METDRTSDQLEDLTAIDADRHTPAEWKTLIRAMRSGETVIVSGSVGGYFLEVLPPRWIPGSGAFAFCEGDDQYTVFAAVDGVWLMRTLAYGERTPAVLELRAREMRSAYGRHLKAIPAPSAAA